MMCVLLAILFHAFQFRLLSRYFSPPERKLLVMVYLIIWIQHPVFSKTNILISSYVDPTGRKISVKYTAGKEGFRILEADHLPKAPQPIAPLPAAAAPQPQQIYQGQPNFLGRQEDDGQYRPDVYERPQQVISFSP